MTNLQNKRNKHAILLPADSSIVIVNITKTSRKNIKFEWLKNSKNWRKFDYYS